VGRAPRTQAVAHRCRSQQPRQVSEVSGLHATTGASCRLQAQAPTATPAQAARRTRASCTACAYAAAPSWRPTRLQGWLCGA